MMTDPSAADREAFDAWVGIDELSVTPLGIWRAALAYERAKTAWQPIETAPKNGDPVLIGCNRTQSIRWAVWSEGFWRDGKASLGGQIVGVPSPSHWCPLPALTAMLEPGNPEVSAGEAWKCVAVRAGQCRLRDEDAEPSRFRVVLEFEELPPLKFSDVWNATPLLLSIDEGAGKQTEG